MFYRYNGNIVEELDSPDAETITSLFYLSGKCLYAGTNNGRLYLFNGVSWIQLVQLQKPLSIRSIWAPSGNDVFLSTPKGVWHYNGATLSGPMYPYCAVGDRIWGTGSSNVYLVGSGGTIMRYGR